mmetsp:Transcript_1569/g.3577  ORF Transcript_1569/g.3577 Transcript_1569/m.3577 type:complete len:297 (-) Transcript_1569:1013-1903(-)
MPALTRVSLVWRKRYALKICFTVPCFAADDPSNTSTTEPTSTRVSFWSSAPTCFAVRFRPMACNSTDRTLLLVSSTLKDECSTLTTTPTALGPSAGSSTRSCSSYAPNRSSPALTSVHSCTSEERTSSSDCVRSEKMYRMGSLEARDALPPACSSSSVPTRSTMPVSPTCWLPPTTLTWSPIWKNLASISAWNDISSWRTLCFGCTVTIKSFVTSCTTPTRCFKSPSITLTTSPGAKSRVLAFFAALSSPPSAASPRPALKRSSSAMVGVTPSHRIERSAMLRMRQPSSKICPSYE